MSELKSVAAVFALLLALAGASTATAQELTPGQTEGKVFVGGVTDGGGLTFGGGIHYAYNPRWLFVAEVGFLAGGNDFRGTVQGVNIDVGSSALSVDLNAHYLFPRSTSSRELTPYLLVGLGILRASASTSTTPPFDVSTSVSDVEAGLNIGGGARWQGGPNWGIQPELKVFVSDNSSVRFIVGLYYQFGR